MPLVASGEYVLIGVLGAAFRPSVSFPRGRFLCISHMREGTDSLFFSILLLPALAPSANTAQPTTVSSNPKLPKKTRCLKPKAKNLIYNIKMIILRSTKRLL
jgi:hypothetical protein